GRRRSPPRASPQRDSSGGSPRRLRSSRSRSPSQLGARVRHRPMAPPHRSRSEGGADPVSAEVRHCEWCPCPALPGSTYCPGCVTAPAGRAGATPAAPGECERASEKNPEPANRTCDAESSAPPPPSASSQPRSSEPPTPTAPEVAQASSTRGERTTEKKAEPV